jgi:VWFA-related protein
VKKRGLSPSYACAAVLLFCAALPGASEQRQKAADCDETRVTLDVTRVSLLTTVTDKKGRFVNDLSKDDFEITEDKRPQSIVQFHAETDVPLRLAVLIDSSNSVRDRFKFIQEAAVAFLQNTLRPGKDKAVIISFDTVVEVIGEMSDDVDALAARIRELRAGRGTALYDAIDFAVQKQLVATDANGDFRRAILILSDGEDTQSRLTRAHCLEVAHKNDTVVYTISTGLDQPNVMGSKVLKLLAEDTGGRSLFPFVVKDLTRAFKDLTAELRNQYSIVYRPEPLTPDGRFHAISVQVKGRKDLSVRTRKGYYAPSR